jgi:hypothetical protein
MSQKSVIVVRKFQSGNDLDISTSIEMRIKVFADLKAAAEHYGWVYNTICRRGNFFIEGNYEVIRKPILRKGGEEKRKKKIDSDNLS